jgi:hypothetical protein
MRREYAGAGKKGKGLKAKMGNSGDETGAAGPV